MMKRTAIAICFCVALGAVAMLFAPAKTLSISSAGTNEPLPVDPEFLDRVRAETVRLLEGGAETVIIFVDPGRVEIQPIPCTQPSVFLETPR